MSNFVTVKKLNKILTVPQERLHYYLNEGYDQIDPTTGKVLKLATGGRMVPLGEYNRLLQRVHELEVENKALRKLLEEAEEDEDDKEEKTEEIKRTRRRKATE